MFKGIINREDAPWPATNMTSEKWRKVPWRSIRIDQLIATQPTIPLTALVGEPPPPYGGDHLVHVIDYDGNLYLEDGHCRTIRAAIDCYDWITARILHVPKKEESNE